MKKHMKKGKLIVALMLIVGIFATAFTVHAESLNDVVNVPDPYLKKLINITLQKPEAEDITKGDMQKLTKLDSDNLPYLPDGIKDHTRGIKDLTGLEYAVNLEYLDVKQNEITDLTPISKLQKLNHLDVNRNELVDISPIKDLKTLEWLNIYNNKIKSIEPVGGLTNLKFLDMHHVNRQTSKIDITPLANLVNLGYLDVGEDLLEDISCLKPVVDSGNLKYFSVRGGFVTDFTVIKPLLDARYINTDESITAATILQKSTEPAAEVKAPTEGGVVKVKLPEIKGFEDVDKHIAGQMWSETSKTVVFRESAPEETQNIEVYYDPTENVALLEFQDNTYGDKIDIETDLVLRFGEEWMEDMIDLPDFTFQVPVHIVQDAKFGFSLGVEGNKQIVNMNTKDYISAERVEGKIVDVDGKPVKLKDVKVEFKKKDTKFDQTALEARDLKIDGNEFTFKIAKKNDVESLPLGNRALSPSIKFQLAGDDTWYEVPANYVINNFFVSEGEALELSSEMVFDLSAEPNADGDYTSRKYDVKIPGGQGISWITVNYLKNGKIVQAYSSKDDPEWEAGGNTGFSLKLKPEEMHEDLELTIATAPLLQNAFIKLKIEPKFVYSKKDQPLEDQFTHNLKDGISVGESKELKLSYNNKPCTGFDAVSADEKILEAKGTTLKGVAVGNTNVTLSGVKFNYVLDGVEFASVEYENDVTKEIAVKAAKVPAGTEDDTDSPLTGDDMQFMFWAFVALAAFGGVAFGLKKNKARN